MNFKNNISNNCSNNNKSNIFLFQSRIRREDGSEVEPAHRFDHQRPGGRTMQDSERQRPARRDLRTFCQPVLKSEIRQFIEKSSNLLKTFQILWHSALKMIHNMSELFVSKEIPKTVKLFGNYLV